MAKEKLTTLENLNYFLSKAKNLFSKIGHTHKLSEVTDYNVDASLSSTSTNPVQNKAVQTEIQRLDDEKAGRDEVRRTWFATFTVVPGEQNPTSDRTFAEIQQAYIDGYTLIARIEGDSLDGIHLPLLGYVPDGLTMFGFDSGATSIGIIIYADNTIEANWSELTADQVGALPSDTFIPSKVSDLTNDSGFLTSSTVPVKSVNGKIGAVQLTYSDVGADASGAASAVQSNLDTLDDKVDDHIGDTTAHMTSTQKTQLTTAYNHSQAAHVQVADSVTSTSTTTAATSKNVKQAYDLANTANTAVGTLNDEFDAHVENEDLHFSSEERNKLSGIATGANKYTHPNSGVTAGTYRSVTVNAAGHVVNASNPTTISGYGITDAYTKSQVDIKVSDTLNSAKDYADGLIDEIMGEGAAETLNTIGELSAAMEENQDAVDLLNAAIGNKVDKVSGKDLSTNDYTTAEKNKLAGIATGAEVNQNAFAKVVVGSSTIEADSKTDSLTFEGENITITADTTNDKVSFIVPTGSTSAKGVVQLTDSTSSTSTTTAATPKSVKSAYDLANTAKSTADSATSTANTNKSNLATHTADTASHFSSAERDKLAGIEAGANAYSLPAATSSTLGGVKVGSNISVSNGTISVPAADGSTAGVTVVYPAVSCTTFSSDSGAITPLAAQKAAKQFAIPRVTSTDNAITRFDGTTGDVQNSNIIIEDVVNTRDSSQAQVIAIPASGGKKMVYGYCTDQIDGTSFIGGVFDASVTEYPYNQGLAIGGTSGNLLWKGTKVATTADLSAYATADHTHNYAGSSSAGGAATSANKLNTDAGSATQPVYFSGGVPKTCTYTLGKSVPSNAVFTDTTYNNATTSVAGLQSAADKTKLDATNVAYGTCITAAATAAKVISISGNSNWTLAVGSIIVVKFSYTNTASNPTFNVNSTGAKSVWYNTALITTGSLSYAGYANRPAIYMYDGTQYVFLSWAYDANSDTKVTQAAAITTDGEYPVMLGYSTATTSVTNTLKKASAFTYNPSTSTLSSGNVVASGTVKVGGGVTLQYNTTNECLDFVFS